MYLAEPSRNFPRKRRVIKENQMVLACTTKATEVNSNELSWVSSMSRFLDQIFSCRRDQYTGFPPRTLLEKCSIPTNAFDAAELERAVWLWERRPKDLFFDGSRILWGRLSLFLVTIFFLVSFDIPGLLVAAALSFAVATTMLFIFYRRELWKRDYEASLFRLVRPYLR